MAKERLSKLQKWILDRIIENTLKKKHLGLLDKVIPCIYRDEIYRDYFKLSHPQHGTWTKKNIVIVSRSLKNLEEKGLIWIPKNIRPKGCMIFLSEEYIRFINKMAIKKSLNVN
ncbi:hypothetical protein ES703_68299 [subsurface metagenome]